MARIKCAISGLTFRCDHIPSYIDSNKGYFHPIFALKRNQLLGLYYRHCCGELTVTDSYLLLLAFLHDTDKILWKVPCSLGEKLSAPYKEGTSTKRLQEAKVSQFVENNLKALIDVIEVSDQITTPAFKQPSFVVNSANCDLKNLPVFIHNWRINIEDFRTGYRQQRIFDDIKKAENQLTKVIASGIPSYKYPHLIANWADKAGDFPINKKEKWKKIIRSCFNSKKMFDTPLADLKEIKAYCEENIEVGSVHFHVLFETLKEGISRHTDYLGMSPIALGYTLLPVDSTKEEEAKASLLAKAPSEEPRRIDFKSDIEYTRAKLRYSIALRKKRNEAKKIAEKGGV